MPLRFDLAIGEPLYIGRGVIMSNKTRMHFVLDGDMPVLKEKDYVSPEAAQTALERLYVYVQRAYLHEQPAATEEYRALAALAAAESPDMYATLTTADKQIVAGDLYRALKSLRVLIRAAAVEEAGA